MTRYLDRPDREIIDRYTGFTIKPGPEGVHDAYSEGGRLVGEILSPTGRSGLTSYVAHCLDGWTSDEETFTQALDALAMHAHQA